MRQEVNPGTDEYPPGADPALPSVYRDILTDFEMSEELAAEWDGFVERVSGDIFLTYDWCRTWWRHYGAGRRLRIYVFRHAGEWVGLLPMFVETVSLGPVSIRRAKLLGSDFTFGQFRPAIEKDYLEPILEMVAEDLDSLGCDQVVLGAIAGRYTDYREFADCLGRAAGRRFTLRSRENYVQTYYRLAEDYEQWLGKFNKSQRTNIRREYRLLERQGISFRFEPASEETWEAMFDDFVELHRLNWNQQGKLGHFGDWPQSLAFHREMALAQMRKGRLRLLRLACSDGSRAYSYNYQCGDMYFELLLARTLASPKGVSLGRLLHSEMVKQAIRDSVGWIDSMQGKYDYKSQQGGQYFPVRWIYLDRRGRRSRIRIGLFGRAAGLFHLVYYKLYFCRLAVKLPLSRRGALWKSWIRACGHLRGSFKPSKMREVDFHA